MTDGSLEIEKKAMSAWRIERLFKWLTALVWCAILVGVFMEASTDLLQDPVLRSWVVGIDVFIVVGLFLQTIKNVWVLDTPLRERLRSERASVSYAILCFIFLLWTPRVAGAMAIGAFCLTAAEHLSKIILGDEILSRIQLKPSQTLALVFGGIIVVGTGILMLPASTADGHGTNFYDAFFTMTSSVSQTGLTVLDTGSFFSVFGQVIILIGMQIGGLGIMILSGAFAVLVGGQLPARQAVGLGSLGATEGMMAQRSNSGEEMRWLFASIAKTTLWFEALGVLVFYVLWLTGLLDLPSRFDNPGGALWWSVFHSVSGFCQGGFTLTPDSLSRWVANPAVNLTFIILITVGGLGFYVTGDLARSNWKEIKSPRMLWKRLQLHTKIVLATSLFMNMIGALVYLFFEYDKSLSHLDPGTKVLASAFQAVTLRSAGFNTVPIEMIAAPTVLLALVFMFIGSGPGSTGGGIRVTTACISVASLRAMVFGRKEVEIFGHTIPQGTVYKSMSVIFIYALLVSVALIVVTANESGSFDVLAFEVMSACGTVGLSMGATKELNEAGKVMTSVMMYIGRVGPLTIALAFAEKVDARSYRYAEEPLDVG